MLVSVDAVTFGWYEGARAGYQIRLRFDGQKCLARCRGRYGRDPWRGDELAQLIMSANANTEVWDDFCAE